MGRQPLLLFPDLSVTRADSTPSRYILFCWAVNADFRIGIDILAFIACSDASYSRYAEGDSKRGSKRLSLLSSGAPSQTNPGEVSSRRPIY